MSSLSSEVADELNKRTKEKVSPEVKISWWRKAIIIFMANCFATLIAGGLLGFFAILWTKANSTDDIAAQLQQHQVMSEAARGERRWRNCRPTTKKTTGRRSDLRLNSLRKSRQLQRSPRPRNA